MDKKPALESKKALKVKSILVSQPAPTQENSPYYDLAKRKKVKIDFRSFIHVEGVDVDDFRQERIGLHKFTAVILTSKNAVDHFFRMCEEMRFKPPVSNKYFCVSEAIALYLQKYVAFRKRRIYHGNLRFAELVPLLKKHKQETFLLPSSDILKPTIPELLTKAKINFTRAILFKTVCSDLSDLEHVFYDILVFFSPSGIKSLFQNFPDFEQKDTRIATFGPTTTEAAIEYKLRVDIEAPTVVAPSMTMVLDQYIDSVNK